MHAACDGVVGDSAEECDRTGRNTSNSSIDEMYAISTVLVLRIFFHR